MTASRISRSLRGSLTWGNDASRRNGDDGPAGGDAGGGPGARGAGIRRRLHRRDQPRPVPPDRPRRARDRAHRARHGHRGGVRPEPDVDGRHRQRPPAVHEGPLHPGPRQPDQAAHREAVLDAVVGAGEADARVHPRHARDLGVLERRRQARLPRRVLPPHAHDAVLQPRPQPVRHPEGVPRRRRRAHDRGRRRGRRRDPAARLHHRAVRARGHHARPRAGLGAGRQATRRLRAVGPDVRGHRHQRGGVRGGPAAARSSRSRSTVRRPRTGACSSCTAGATSRASSTACRSRASGCRWASSSTTRSSGTFAVSGEPEEIPAKLLDRYGDVVDRVSFYAPYKSNPERWARVVEGFKSGA